MNEVSFASVNTLIRLKEQELLTKEQLDGLLRSQHFEQALSLLKPTVYTNISHSYESELMTSLSQTYALLYEEMPECGVLDLFSLIYTYHNIKVLLKTELSESDFSRLLMPIGRYTIPELTHAIKSGELNVLPDILSTAIQQVKEYVAEYGTIDAVDILLDRAYFEHLNIIAANSQDSDLIDMVKAWTDLYNASCVIRVSRQNVGRSFLQSVLSTQGFISVDEWVQLSTGQQLDAIYNRLQEEAYAPALKLAVDSDIIGYETAKDFVAAYYLEQASLQPFGYLPALAYIYHKEMEVKNLRLILTGKDNGIDEAILRERMRPIYDV